MNINMIEVYAVSERVPEFVDGKETWVLCFSSQYDKDKYLWWHVKDEEMWRRTRYAFSYPEDDKYWCHADRMPMITPREILALERLKDKARVSVPADAGQGERVKEN